MACACGTPPQECVRDEEWVTQVTDPHGNFYNEPRDYRSEVEVSALRGKLQVAEALRYVMKMPPNEADIARNGVRHAQAGTLREAGFAVVHTPGRRIRQSPHVSIVWPDDDPLARQDTPWPADVSLEFNRCLNEDEG